SARICDRVGNCRTQTAGYYYDAIAPAIDIASGTRSGSFLPVTIDWWDDRALDYAGSRVITFNGAAVTLQFTTLSQTATTARDSARLVLESGRNVVVASICDGVGHCSTDSLSYEYDTVAPAVTLQPGDGGYIGAPDTITIEWCDDRDLNPSSVRVEVDDDGFVRDITSAFRYQSGGQGGCGAYATSVADTLTFWTDSVMVTAEIRDQTGNLGSASATYRVDAVAPTAVIEPQAGSYEHPTVAVPVAVAWEDDVGLALGTRRITLTNANGTTDLTGGFEHGGDMKRGWSEGRVALTAGANTLAAEVCDLAGNCVPETTAVYTLDLGPEVTITATPPRIRASSPLDPPVPVIVQIDWSDAEGLDAGTKQITLDGADVTGSFHHSLGATSGSSIDTIPVAVGADTVTARICDTAEHCTTRTAKISHGVPAAPTVTTAGLNPGVTTARGLCLTAQVGPGAASECGDLRLAHALPAAATMNKARALTLLYNSAHAEPQTLLAADVRLSATAGAPDSVTATLTVDGSSAVPWATWTGTAWTTGEARRIVLQDTTPRATGIHAYRLTVTSWY
ncbi:MAG: hypothetical protein GWO04_46620, partial [Actinobacteria bacterium]|nr:hypothetical protein [Actinomycetota bacterium]